MKKPIFSKEQIQEWIVPEFEIAKMKLKRAIHKSYLGIFAKFLVEKLSGIL